MYWSVRRELWENRSIYLAPAIVAGVVLFASLIGTIGLPGRVRNAAGDPAKLHDALRNLLENARRYGGSGEITVVLRPPPAGGGATTVQVCDRGAGVPAEMRERIFEPFFRLPGHAEREGGVGLGLALVKQIAEAHGGEVSVGAADGGGAVFRLWIPVPEAD